MRQTFYVSTALFACCCVFLLVAGPAAAVNCERKPDHPQCTGGGQGGGNTPVELTFRDDAADKIRSDVAVSGTVTYTDGESGVSARFRDDGILLFNIDDTDRAVVLDFSDQSQPAECTVECKKKFDIASTDNYPPGAQAAVQVFDKGGSQHRVDQFLGMIEAGWTRQWFTLQDPNLDSLRDNPAFRQIISEHAARLGVMRQRFRMAQSQMNVASANQ